MSYSCSHNVTYLYHNVAMCCCILKVFESSHYRVEQHKSYIVFFPWRYYSGDEDKANKNRRRDSSKKEESVLKNSVKEGNILCQK